MLLFNQKQWGRLAQKEWLVNGDRNSSYFQRQANSRHKKLLIIKIKDDVGGWIEDQPTLQQKFLDDYINRFKSAAPHTRHIPNLGLPQIVTKEDNFLVTQPVTL